MKKILSSLFLQYLFWILFFDLNRLVFILYHTRLLAVEKIPVTEVAGIFWYSLRLDTGTACYLLVIPFILLVVQSVYSPSWLNYLNKIYTGIMILAYSLTEAGEMGIYAEWKTKLTYKALKYLSHPTEIYNSAQTLIFFLLLGILIFLFLAGLFAYLRIFYREILHVRRNWIFTFLFLVITPPLLLIGMRGGVQQIPINQSESYYSRYNILNLASVNNLFNLYISTFENLHNFNRNPFIFMDEKEAERQVKELFRTPSDSTVKILTTRRPNIVILILESWSADLVEDLGGKPGITPEFHELEKGGILFDQIYASGSRSEQGMACIFSGFPAIPLSSITVQPDKFVKLPSLPRLLNSNGYSTSFYFGGQLIYGNIKGYIMYNNFGKIMEGYDFPSSLPRGKLGIHDQYTLDYQLHDVGKQQKPFFSALFTVSTHSPYDQPYPKPLNWGDNEHEYINGAYYTDHCLGDYFRKVSHEPWFDSTLFIIVADHSHNSYRNWHPNSKYYHKIPLLFYGKVIKEQYRGTVWHHLGNQHDLPATLLAQMGIPAQAFHWSKNLFNPGSQQFAQYATEDGIGWIRPDGWFCWDEGPNYFYFLEADPAIRDSLIHEGKAYLQVSFNEYVGD